MDPRAADDPLDIDLGLRLKVAIWFLAISSLIILALRVYCKFLRKRGLWWDDYILIASWFSLLAAVSLQTACTFYGLGKHSEQLDPPTMKMNSRLAYAGGFCCILSLGLSKTSFCLTLMRISSGWTKCAVWFVLLSVDAVLIAHGAIQWLQCWPTAKMWDWDIPGKCMNPATVTTYNTFSTLYSGSMDIILAFLPWGIIMTVQINKREKIGVLIAMSTSIFAGIISFVKIRTHYAIADKDIATNVNMFIMGTAEPAMTIIAASIPILRHLFKRSNYSNARTGERTADQSFNKGVSLRSLRKPEDSINIDDVDKVSILPQFRQEESREQYGREESREQYGREESRPQYMDEESREQYRQEELRPRYREEETRPTYRQKESRPQYQERMPQQGEDEWRSPHYRQDDWR